jgi:hypothetical protein
VERWHDFFVAQVGATAALTGLLFVAISINLRKILETRYLVDLAGQTLIILTSALCLSSFALFPNVDSAHVRWAMAATAFIAWMLATALLRALHLLPKERKSPARVAQTVILTECATFPPFAGTVYGALTGRPIPELLACGVIFALVAGLYSAWLLMIEILR